MFGKHRHDNHPKCAICGGKIVKKGLWWKHIWDGRTMAYDHTATERN